MTIKKGRGLLDFASRDDGEWEYEEISPDYVPGLGFGATEQVRRWAYIGYQIEIGSQLKALTAHFRKPVGGQAKEVALQINQMRAAHMWLELRDMPKSFRTESTNRKLISWMSSREHRDAEARKRWLPNSNLERSLSMGRTFWGIQDDWSCPTLEEGLKLALQKS
jgi:hypothetical protein